MNLKGYVSVAIPVPVSVQNLVLRDYCQRNGHRLSLSDVEFLGGEHKMLDGMELSSFDGICAYSMWILPQGFLIPSGKEVHCALENLVCPKDNDRIAVLYQLRSATE